MASAERMETKEEKKINYKNTKKQEEAHDAGARSHAARPALSTARKQNKVTPRSKEKKKKQRYAIPRICTCCCVACVNTSSVREATTFVLPLQHPHLLRQATQSGVGCFWLNSPSDVRKRHSTESRVAGELIFFAHLRERSERSERFKFGP